ncbi:cobalamin B12-binding domain-containing protein [Nocardia sp. NPDC059239]|uniref:cobalamin B12-binding domain-containing protein n=1 Tax=unclassified Nocardia TaxID=2637762 RepID=UPI0036A51D9D
MGAQERYRVLVAKPGLDSHDRGTRVLAAELMRSGFEVIYTGVCLSPEAIARAAVDEDVETVCLSMHVGAHIAMTENVMKELRAIDGHDIPVICGGVIPVRDHDRLRELGVAWIVPPRASLQESIEGISQYCGAYRMERDSEELDSAEGVR